MEERREERGARAREHRIRMGQGREEGRRSSPDHVAKFKQLRGMLRRPLMLGAPSQPETSNSPRPLARRTVGREGKRIRTTSDGVTQGVLRSPQRCRVHRLYLREYMITAPSRRTQAVGVEYPRSVQVSHRVYVAAATEFIIRGAGERDARTLVLAAT